MLITLKRHRAEIEALQAQIKELEAPFTMACKILGNRGIYHDSKGRFIAAETLDFNKARKAIKNG